MIRWIGRKILFCIVLLSLFHYLNVRNPDWMQTLGEWIGGEVGNRVSVTVSGMLDRLEEGTPLADAVEVFREST